ncbi:MAG: hypothetical protein ACP5IA_11665 [Sediminispirochaetaceae bacterium]
MKYSSRSRSTLIRLVLLGLLAGTLAWALAERALSYTGIIIDMGIGPIGFDLRVLAVSLYVNPGSLLGAAGGWILFRRL